MNRFGELSTNQIDDCIQVNVSEPKNTNKTKKFVWKQFLQFCTQKNYVLDESTATEKIADILKDWAFNMRKVNGEEYKENVVKTIWNITAKMIQDKYFEEYGREMDPFAGIIFKAAREARNAKRRMLKTNPEKRTQSASPLEDNEYHAMLSIWDENTPEGLQFKFFLIASTELSWRASEGAYCLLHYFKEELDINGIHTGRLGYNPTFSKGGIHKCPQSKFLSPNLQNLRNCPVRLFKKLLAKRNENKKITTDRLFLTVNPSWNKPFSSGWYKNTPVGINEITKWTAKSAKLAGLDIRNKKITNRSNRGAGMSRFANRGSVPQLITITGLGNAHLIQPILQPIQQLPQNIQPILQLDQQLQLDQTQQKNIIVNQTVPPTPMPCSSSSMDQITSTHDDEFDLFCKSLAYQLKRMPLERALMCQEKLQAVMTEERLNELESSRYEQQSESSSGYDNIVVKEEDFGTEFL